MRSRKTNSLRPAIENLADRLTPSVSVINGAIHVTTGIGNDVVSVNYRPSIGSYVVTENGSTSPSSTSR